VKSFYVVPTAAVAATPPRGAWHAIACPGDPTWSLCVVVAWTDNTADDEWEAIPGVRPLHPENWGNTVPAVAVTAFGPWGVITTDTIRQAFEKIRRVWSHARQG